MSDDDWLDGSEYLRLEVVRLMLENGRYADANDFMDGVRAIYEWIKSGEQQHNPQ